MSSLALRSKTVFATSVFLLFATEAGAAALAASTCELLTERISNYEKLMDELVFLDDQFVASNPSFRQFYLLNVTNAVIAGEIEKIAEAKSQIERLCQ